MLNISQVRPTLLLELLMQKLPILAIRNRIQNEIHRYTEIYISYSEK